ncbi:DNA utilization protein GntX [Phycisphaerae bacterium RAS1]|nr:DNA utilization protein GntX [Phycisphaerae bacterium RAS1]
MRTPVSTLGLLARAGRTLLDVAVPQLCVGCQAWVGDSGGICGACREAIGAAAATPYCPRCGRSAQPLSITPDGCRRCMSEPFWNIVEAVRVGPYEEPLRAIVLGLKYRGLERNAEILADWLAEAMLARPWTGTLDLLAPVPMHLRRRVQRPGNHALMLAAALESRLRRAGCRLRLTRAVRRHVYAPSQTTLTSRTRRFENVRECFAPRWWPPVNLRGKTVCIVDNLLTTGATIHEVSKVLRRAGAATIYAAVVARSVAPGDVQAHSAAV